MIFVLKIFNSSIIMKKKLEQILVKGNLMEYTNSILLNCYNPTKPESQDLSQDRNFWGDTVIIRWL